MCDDNTHLHHMHDLRFDTGRSLRNNLKSILHFYHLNVCYYVIMTNYSYYYYFHNFGFRCFSCMCYFYIIIYFCYWCYFSLLLVLLMLLMACYCHEMELYVKHCTATYIQILFLVDMREKIPYVLKNGIVQD